ncbi:hypothetical protein CAC42_2281 [Sphaceloma murrayae]|uniref:Uncharacterized protein n=1 Tax=Sphaceloma murrayae TaxID=2082308 RepID=A0A2K1QJI2_9PEZI|nr:hypothetical protein CAC42_2281 [Sphaceloma murrayae]
MESTGCDSNLWSRISTPKFRSSVIWFSSSKRMRMTLQSRRLRLGHAIGVISKREIPSDELRTASLIDEPGFLGIRIGLVGVNAMYTNEVHVFSHNMAASGDALDPLTGFKTGGEVFDLADVEMSDAGLRKFAAAAAA